MLALDLHYTLNVEGEKAGNNTSCGSILTNNNSRLECVT